MGWQKPIRLNSELQSQLTHQRKLKRGCTRSDENMCVTHYTWDKLSQANLQIES